VTRSTRAEVVDLWYTRCGAATASALAIRKNWLQNEFAGSGVVLHSLRDSDRLEIRNSHYHHAQTGMFREGGNIPPIWAKGCGQNTVVLGITWLDEYQGILARAGSNIRVPHDLKGKRLALPLHENAVIDFQRGAAQHGFATALALAGLRPTDAIFVDVLAPGYDSLDGPRQRPSDSERRDVALDALEKGHVDAAFIRFAGGVRAARDPRFQEVLNINTLRESLLRVNNGTPRPITVDRPFLEKHPEIVVRYLAVLLRTAAWAAENHEEVVRLLAPEDGGGTVEEIVASHGAAVHESFTPKLTDEYVDGLEAQKNFLRDWGYLIHDFDVRKDWIVAEPLRLAQQRVAAQPSGRSVAA
jgi:sulfonate transport system substrate-binding protein